MPISHKVVEEFFHKELWQSFLVSQKKEASKKLDLYRTAIDLYLIWQNLHY